MKNTTEVPGITSSTEYLYLSILNLKNSFCKDIGKNFSVLFHKFQSSAHLL